MNLRESDRMVVITPTTTALMSRGPLIQADILPANCEDLILYAKKSTRVIQLFYPYIYHRDTIRYTQEGCVEDVAAMIDAAVEVHVQ
jgi:hypothetical protein